MSNFEFLKDQTEYALFAPAAIEAEKVFATSPAMCAIGARKALELAVKWVYSADFSMMMPYKDNLQSLIHEPTFRFAVDSNTWGKLPYIIKLGNLAVHTEKSVSPGDAILSLHGLFEFIEWIDYCYGTNYVERSFDAAKIPAEKVVIDTKKIKEQESLLNEKDSEIEALRKKIAEMAEQYTKEKEQHEKERSFQAEDLSEFHTRKKYIDLDLKLMGWKLTGIDQDVLQEFPVNDMMGKLGQEGYCDYVLMGKDQRPLAVVEAKRTSKDPNIGRKQCVLYADCLERKYGRRPMMFTTNGFDTYFWDDKSGPQRKVYGIFSKDDLQRLMNRRVDHQELDTIVIDDKITNRYYQKEAIRAVCDHVKQGFRKNLLVMATGTGKTRTAASLVDVFSRGGYVTNVLFLADRTALVKQAKDSFKEYLPNMTLCNLCSNKDDRNARIVFSTYPTMMNAIDDSRSKDGERLFTPAHFDMIIIDESHRSIFKKYRTIFEYFDAILVGLTATPKTDVDRNTYDFFEMEDEVPTYAYDYETAVYTDHVLVPYYNYKVKTEFLENGITYSQLSRKDQERLEDAFTEDNMDVPDFIPSGALNKFIFNTTTVDMVLQDLMERGIKIEGGEKIGKTIIFAQSKRHAEFILERFNKLYPKYKGSFIQRVICDDAYAQTIIDDFRNPEKDPQIAVSVDMMDTGIDVPEAVNLVFFKQVKSKTKFWQMIGRGTRLCPELLCMDSIDGEYGGKRRFLIFDYCGNFDFFETHKEGYAGSETRSLSELIFIKKISLAQQLQTEAYASPEFQAFRQQLVTDCQQLVCALNTELVSVHTHLKYVENYKKPEQYQFISDEMQTELLREIAPLVHIEGKDESAKRFDNFMYNLMLQDLDGTALFPHLKDQLVNICELLAKKISIPQVLAKLPVLKRVRSEEFWETNDVLEMEKVRQELRGLIQFLTGGKGTKPIYTTLADTVIDRKEGEQLAPAYEFVDYKKKVNRYINDHGNAISIHKLTHNIPLTSGDYEELERILTEELGNKEDYEKAYGDTPFGLLIRKIAKLDHTAAMAVFSEFINDQSLNQKQIAFVNKIISYIENNGYMENTDLMKPPFDKPVSFIKLFDPKRRTEILQKIQEVKENAVRIEA
ncbi:MAG TPA: DEAD/DEAH box helicase [Oribacterium sp.]|nr:DEAD/DEAH box helicase [Oribacterium sp.]